MTLRIFGVVCAYVFILLVNTANAAVVNPIIGLNIDGAYYDVIFHDSSGDSFNGLWDADDNGVFGGGTSVFSVAPMFWGDQAGAELARDAIMSRGWEQWTPQPVTTTGF